MGRRNLENLVLKINLYKKILFFSSGGTVVKNLPAYSGDTRDSGSIPGLERSLGEGNGNPLLYPCLGNPTDRSLAGYSLWHCKESDMTEHTHTHTHTHLFNYQTFL